MDVGWMDTDDLRKHHKRGRAIWSGIPVSLFILFFLLSFGMLGLPAILPVGIAAFLFYKFSKQACRLPKWIYTIAFLLLGFLMWSFFANGPLISNRVATWIFRYSGLGATSGEPTVLVSEDIAPRQSQTQVVAEDSLASQPGQVTAENISPEIPANLPVDQEEPAPAQVAAAPDQEAFDAYINRGLKAVEDEEYSVANQNFKNAFNANPRHPRLQQLAAEFRKSADEKCQDFKNANAKELSHIPNNYYQYAASLTQTVPLKCD